MKHQLRKVLAVGILAFWSGLSTLSMADDTTDAIRQAVNNCNTALTGAEQENIDATAEANKLEALLNKPAAPAAASGNVPGALVSTASLELIQTKEMLKFSASLQQQAREKLTSVETSPDSETARDRLKEAQDMMVMARKLTRRANAILRPASQPWFSGAKSAAIQLSGEGAALAQLRRAASVGQSAQGRVAFYEVSRDAPSYNENSMALTVPDGRTIDVRTLAAAFRSTVGPRVPLFRPVPAPDGTMQAVSLNPQAVEVLRNPQKRAELERVGGVELKVTLDLLEFLELPDFRKPGPALVIDQPVLLSLRALASAARPYAVNWGSLPEYLRFPGGLKRVVGFVLDPARQDIFLVGVSARLPGQRLDIDAIIIALRSVWMEGLTPSVSLDPLPEAPGGAQYSRIVGVPDTSIFARIMLDADYEMKRIMTGKRKINVPSYRNLLQLITALGDASESDRFWFFPVPLGAGDLQVSSTARTVLFNSGLTVLTESERLTAQGFEGTGKEGNQASRAAKLFTAALDTLEQSEEVSPKGIFSELHGLVDVVTLCEVWRKAGIDSPVLQDLSKLPVRRLEDTEAVPKYYPGVTVRATANGKDYQISGGVQARVRPTQRSLDRFRDRSTMALESAVDRFPRDGTITQPLAFRITLPKAGSANSQLERIMATGEAALAAGDYDKARTEFSEVTRKEPFNVGAWAYLGQAQSQLGQHQAAAVSIARARALEPMDEELRILALDIELCANPRLDLSSRDPSIRRTLGEDYVSRAIAALSAGRRTAATQLGDKAIVLNDENADAYYVRALSLGTSDGAMNDLGRAIERYRRRVRNSVANSDRLALARAIGRLAYLRAGNVDVTAAILDAGKANSALAALQRIVEDLSEARLLAPSDPLILTIEINTRVARALIYKAHGPDDPNTDALRDLADRLVDRYPDFPLGHHTRSLAYQVSGRSSEALAELTITIQQDPTFGHAYLERAQIYIGLGLCERARADAVQARKLKESGIEDIEWQIANCAKARS